MNLACSLVILFFYLDFGTANIIAFIFIDISGSLHDN